MVATQPEINKEQRGTIDTSPVTVAAFNAIDKLQQSSPGIFDKTLEQTKYLQTHKNSIAYPLAAHSPNHKTKVKVVTNQDQQEHTYFHSMSLDAQVTDFMHTCELRCPYDSDLMEYWEPIRQSCVVYGANQGDYKVLFIGRVREVIQDGYELSITLQNYGWKFKQDIPQSYVDDNIIGKNGFMIMLLMFEALKIESYAFSESAEERLRQVSVNSDGNVTVNGEEVEEMPDLLERLKESNPSQFFQTNYALSRKLCESHVANIQNINYTLKYEEKTPRMQQIDSLGSSNGANTLNDFYDGGQSIPKGAQLVSSTTESVHLSAKANSQAELNQILSRKINSAMSSLSPEAQTALRQNTSTIRNAVNSAISNGRSVSKTIVTTNVVNSWF